MTREELLFEWQITQLANMANVSQPVLVTRKCHLVECNRLIPVSQPEPYCAEHQRNLMSWIER